MKATTFLTLKEDMIHVPRFEQKQRMWCGPAVLQSLLFYNKFRATQDEISESIDMEEGCLIQELGLFALSKNFDVKISSYDMIYLDPTWNKLSELEVMERIKLRLSNGSFSKNARISYRTLIKYLSDGGKLSISIPNKENIISTLREGTPILAIVNSNSFYDRIRLNSHGKKDDVTGSAGGHFVLLTGYKNGYFYLVDPTYDNPVAFVQEDRFLFSLSLWGGWMMTINEKTSLSS